jgi:hypothetical protein
METGTVVLVVGVGVAGFLFWRSQQQATVATAQAKAAAAAGIPATGGGVSGLASRALANWQADPLGIQNTKNAVHFLAGAGTNAVKSVSGGVASAVSYVKNIF